MDDYRTICNCCSKNSLKDDLFNAEKENIFLKKLLAEATSLIFTNPGLPCVNKAMDVNSEFPSRELYFWFRKSILDKNNAQ